MVELLAEISAEGAEDYSSIDRPLAMKVGRRFLKTSKIKIDLLQKGRVTTPKIDQKVDFWACGIPLMSIQSAPRDKTQCKVVTIEKKSSQVFSAQGHIHAEGGPNL